MYFFSIQLKVFFCSAHTWPRRRVFRFYPGVKKLMKMPFWGLKRGPRPSQTPPKPLHFQSCPIDWHQKVQIIPTNYSIAECVLITKIIHYWHQKYHVAVLSKESTMNILFIKILLQSVFKHWPQIFCHILRIVHLLHYILFFNLFDSNKQFLNVSKHIYRWNNLFFTNQRCFKINSTHRETKLSYENILNILYFFQYQIF